MHNENPPAPGRMCVNSNMVADVSKDIHKAYHVETVIDEKSPKRLLTLYDKERYVVHIRNLKCYLDK